MKIEGYLTDAAVLNELGTRLERTRLERNLSQLELATEAGVERKTVQRIEAGEQVRLISFIRVLRALGLIDALDQLVAEPLPSPIELLKLHDKRRRRASGARLKSRTRPTSGQEEEGQSARPATATWRWGDQTPPGA